MPGKCAAPPAAAMMTRIPFSAAVAVYWAIHWGVRCALVMRTVKEMEKEVRVVRHGCRVGRSEWEPMITAMRGC